MEIQHFLIHFPEKETSAAPSTVTPQVNQVGISCLEAYIYMI